MVLYVRSAVDFGTHDRQRAVLDRLERLREAGRIDDYAVETWGKSVVLHETTSDSTDRTIDAIDAFRKWAADRNRSLEPAFREQRTTEPGSTRSHTRLTLPVMCLAIYDGDELTGVFPCTEEADHRVHTVTDALDDLERSERQRDRVAGERPT